MRRGLNDVETKTFQMKVFPVLTGKIEENGNYRQTCEIHIPSTDGAQYYPVQLSKAVQARSNCTEQASASLA